MRKIAVATAICGVFFSFPSYADDSVDWSKLSLDQLQNLKVTSVSKKSERAFDAAAAIYVITKEDIRRSGATSIPEALRLAPGVQVARSSANKWAISIRGFNDQFSNKLLVLIDGRSVYTPMFSGVFWDIQDTLLEDIKQIEVIRGPGATLWGANAVNGVINIITEETTNTQGKYISTTFGNKEKGSTGARIGGKLSDDAYYRVYAKYTNHAEEENLATGLGAGDAWNSLRSGFRVDWDKTSNNTITMQGDVYRNSEDQQLELPSGTAPFSILSRDNEIATGGNVLMRWKHLHGGGANSTLQLYYDNAAREGIYWDQNINTLDVDFQHSLPVQHRNEITFGVGYRLVNDHFGTTPYINFLPASRNTNLYSAFIQDTIHLIEKKLFLTLGTKYEYNAYTEGEVQPSARLSFLPTDKQTLWASVSRAVRVPNRAMDDVNFPVVGTPFGFAGLVGDRVAGLPTAESEELIAYETGYRIQATKTLTFDVTAFYNDYSKLISNYAVTPLTFAPANQNSGESYGFEAGTKWEATKNWELAANYTYLTTELNVVDTTNLITGGKSPKHQYNITSHYKFPHHIEMSNMLYTVGRLPAINVPSYTRFDTVLAWKSGDDLELSLVGQNLFNNAQQEFDSFVYSQPERIGRTFYVNLRLWF